MVINPWTFLLEAVNFVVLAFVLHRLLYRPLHEAIDRRRAAIERAQAEAEAARQQAAELQGRVEAQRAALERQRQELVRQAREQAEVERQRILAEAERAAQQRQDEARRAIEQERQEAIEALRQELVSRAVELAERLLLEASDTTLHQQLARRVVETLERLPQSERERLRAAWQPDGGAVVETARELDSATVARLEAVVAAILGRPVALAIETRPALLGGIRVRLGGQMWDGSLAGQLEALRRSRAEVMAHG